jgi:hypothetical protein
MQGIDRYWILVSGYWSKEIQLLIQHQESSIQHHFVSINGALLPPNHTLEAELH